MKVLSEEEYFRIYQSRSVILNPPSKDRHIPPTISRPLFVSGLKGLERLHADLVVGEDSELGHHKEVLRKAKVAWEKFRAAQGKLDDKAPPVGVFAERINRSTAMIKVLEAEGRKIASLIAEAKKKQT